MGMKMKKMQVSCASSSSTAICSSVDQHYSSMVKNSTRSFQRLNTYLAAENYSPTSSKSRGAPCSISELPLTPRPSSYYTYTDKSRKLSSHLLNHNANTHQHVLNTPTRTSTCMSNSTCGADVDVSHTKEYNNHKYSRLVGGESVSEDENRRRNYKGRYVPTTSTPVFGSETTRDMSRSTRVERREFRSMLDEEKEKIRKHFSLIDVGGGGDSGTKARENTWRYEEGGYKHSKSSCGRRKDWDSNNRTSTSSTPSRKHQDQDQDQVVVLRVSLHCRGCENKLRKHLFKMQGITSYEIDMETKKVTVIGNITPIEVLTSISKVKNAQFWPSHDQPPPTFSSTSTLDYFN